MDFKLFTRTLTERLVLVTARIVGQNQTGFVRGRNILEGVVIIHEVLHELKRSKKKRVLLKIDFEKAYDRVSWPFLEQVMLGRGFPQKWVAWIMQTVRGASMH